MLDGVTEDKWVETLVQKAAWVHASLKDLHFLPMAMRLVGFKNEEATNRSLQQRVWHLSMKMAGPPPSAIKATDSQSVSELLSAAVLLLSGTSGDSPISSSEWNTRERMELGCTSSEQAIVDDVVVNLEAKLASADDSGTVSSSKMAKTATRTRRTPHQLQENHASRGHMKLNKKESLKIIASVIEDSRHQCPDAKDKRCVSMLKAVNKLNAICGLNESEVTAACHL